MSPATVIIRPGQRLWANARIDRAGGICPGCAKPLPVGSIAIFWRGLVGCWRCVFAVAAQRMVTQLADGTLVNVRPNTLAISLPVDTPTDPAHVVPIRGG